MFYYIFACSGSPWTVAAVDSTMLLLLPCLGLGFPASLPLLFAHWFDAQAGANGASATAAAPKPKPVKPAAAPAATKPFTNINRSGSLVSLCSYMCNSTMLVGDVQPAESRTANHIHCKLPLMIGVATLCRFVVPEACAAAFLAEWKQREADMGAASRISRV